jgi:2-methylcitrate dehydratase PrpD
MDAAYTLSDFISHTSFKDIPAEIVDVVKKEILDCLAVMLGGTSDDTARRLYSLVGEWGGREESSIIGYQGKFPSPHAALVNGSMSNALDYDDTHERAHLHVGGVVIPPAFAISEAVGKVTGKDFITAVCVAVELGCRLGMAVKPAKKVFMGGWSFGPLLGHFTAAAVTAKLLNLDEEGTHNALGIAYHQASGNAQAMRDKAASKKIGPGFASRDGVTASLMAARGITGAKSIFDESEIGFFNLYHAGCNRDVLLDNLGRKFEMYDVSFKPYPCCRLNHRFIDAVLKLVEGNNIIPEEIELLEVSVCGDVYETLCTPPQEKKAPQNAMAAQFSLPWTLACGIVRRKATTSEFNLEALSDPKLLNMAARIKPILNPALPDEHAFSQIRLTTKKNTFETETTHPLGSVELPVTFDDLGRKLLDCSSIASISISPEELSQVISMVKNLEDVKRVDEIVQLLCDRTKEIMSEDNKDSRRRHKEKGDMTNEN